MFSIQRHREEDIDLINPYGGLDGKWNLSYECDDNLNL